MLLCKTGARSPSQMPHSSRVPASGSRGLSTAPVSVKGPTDKVKGYVDTLDHICAGKAMEPQAVLVSSSTDMRAQDCQTSGTLPINCLWQQCSCLLLACTCQL